MALTRKQLDARAIVARQDKILGRALRDSFKITRVLMAEANRLWLDGIDPTARIGQLALEYSGPFTEAMLDGFAQGRIMGLERAAPHIIRARGLSYAFRSAGLRGEALEFVKERAALSPEQAADIAELYGAEASTIARGVGQQLESKIARAVAISIEKDLPIPEGAKLIGRAFNTAGVVPRNPYLLDTLIRTQTATAYAAGRWQANEDPAIQSILWGYEYSTAGDDRVRPEHLALEGITLPKEDPRWNTLTPPNGYCLPPGTMVDTDSGRKPIDEIVIGDCVWTHRGRCRRVIHVFRRETSDKLKAIVFDDHTRTFRATGEHYISTKRGWVQASGLQAGDEIIDSVQLRGSEKPGIWDVDNILESKLSDDSPMPNDARCFGPLNLDANIESGQEDVEPIPSSIDGMFMWELGLFAKQNKRSFALARLHLGIGVIFRMFCESLLLCSGHLGPHLGTPGRCCDPQCGGSLSSAFRMKIMVKLLSLGPASHGDAMTGHDSTQSPECNASLVGDVSEAALLGSVIGDHSIDSTRPASFYAGLSSHPISVLSAHGTIVTRRYAKIKSITDEPYCGTVYDLEVEDDHSFVADGHIVSNSCRCTLLEVYDTDEQAVITPPPGDVEIEGQTVKPGPDAQWSHHPLNSIGQAPKLDSVPVSGKTVKPPKPKPAPKKPAAKPKAKKPVAPKPKKKPAEKPKTKKPVAKPKSKKTVATKPKVPTTRATWDKHEEVDSVGSMLNAKRDFKKSFGVDVDLKGYTSDPRAGIQQMNKLGAEMSRMRSEFPALSQGLDKTNVKTIRLFNKNTIKAPGLKEGQGISAQYKPSQKTMNLSRDQLDKSEKITLGKWNSSDGWDSVFRHEMGHHSEEIVFGSTGSPKAELRKEWKKTVADLGQEATKKTISRYAATDASEAFAESFSVYTSPKYKRGMLPKPIEKFMDKNIRGSAL